MQRGHLYCSTHVYIHSNLLCCATQHRNFCAASALRMCTYTGALTLLHTSCREIHTQVHGKPASISLIDVISFVFGFVHQAQIYIGLRKCATVASPPHSPDMFCARARPWRRLLALLLHAGPRSGDQARKCARLCKVQVCEDCTFPSHPVYWVVWLWARCVSKHQIGCHDREAGYPPPRHTFP